MGLFISCRNKYDVQVLCNKSVDKYLYIFLVFRYVLYSLWWCEKFHNGDQSLDARACAVSPSVFDK